MRTAGHTAEQQAIVPAGGSAQHQSPSMDREVKSETNSELCC